MKAIYFGWLIFDLGGAFFLNQAVFELYRLRKSSWAACAVIQLDRRAAFWDFLGVVAGLGGVSLIAWSIIYWVWWKALLLWIACALAGGLLTRFSISVDDPEKVIRIERLYLVVTIVLMVFLWWATLSVRIRY